MTVKQFVTKYKAEALISEREKGINHLFILGQAALESGWSKNAPGNNFFGIKATESTPANKKQLLFTNEVFANNQQGYRFPEVISITRRKDGKYDYRVKDWFMKYDTPAESFADHADLFYRASRYASALKVKDDPHKFADAIAKAGYATAPNYATTLKSTINTIKNAI